MTRDGSLSPTIYILALCQALMMSSTTLMVTASSLVGFALAEDKSLATLPLALQFLSTMLTSIPASLFMGRFGRKPGFMLAAVVGTCGGVLALYAITKGDFWLFGAAAMLLGVFNGFGSYYRFAAAEEVDEAHRSRAISFVLAGGVIAAFVGPNLANLGQDLIGSARFAGSFAFIILLYLMALGLLAFSRFSERPIAHPTEAGRPLAVIVRQPRFIVALVCAMFGYGIMSFIMTATPLAMERVHHPFGDTAIVIQWHVLGMFAPSFFTGNLIHRFGVQPILRLGALAMILTVIINLGGTTYWHFWAALFLLGIGWNFLFIGGTSLLTEVYWPEERSKVQALNDFLVFSTTATSSWFAGSMLYEYGWYWVNVSAVPLLGLVVLSLVWLWRAPGKAQAA